MTTYRRTRNVYRVLVLAQFLAHAYYGQTVAWIKMPVGHILFDGDPAVPKKKGHIPPIFGPCLLWPNSWMDQDTTWYGGRFRPSRHCVRWGPCSPKKGHSPRYPRTIFGLCLLLPNGWMDQDATWYEYRPRSRPHCAGWGLSPVPQKDTDPQFSAHV